MVLKGGGRRGWVCCCCVGGCSVVEDMFFLWGSLCAKGSVCLIPIVRSSDSETAGFLCSRRLGAQVGVVGCVKWWIGLGCGCQKVDSIHQIEFLTDALLTFNPTITPPCRHRTAMAKHTYFLSKMNSSISLNQIVVSGRISSSSTSKICRH